MTTQSALATAIWSKLANGTALTTLLDGGSASIFRLQPPEGFAGTAYIVFNQQSGLDDNETPTRSRDVLYNIRAITVDAPALAGSIDAQIDALLHGKTLTISGWTNFWTVREDDIEMFEADETGQRFYTTGGIYRLRISK